MPRLIPDSGRWFWPLFVVLSLLVNLLQVPVLHGTFGALVVAVLTQVYLPGYRPRSTCRGICWRGVWADTVYRIQSIVLAGCWLAVWD